MTSWDRGPWGAVLGGRNSGDHGPGEAAHAWRDRRPPPASPPGAPPDSGTARQQLQDTERARADSLAAQRAADARAAAAAEAEQHLAAARIEAAARLHDAEASTLAVAHRIDALARARQAAEAG